MEKSSQNFRDLPRKTVKISFSPSPIPSHYLWSPWPALQMHLCSLCSLNQILGWYTTQNQFYIRECVHSFFFLFNHETMTFKCFLEWLHYCQRLHSTKPGVSNIQDEDASFNYKKCQSASHMEGKGEFYFNSLRDRCTSNFQLLKSKACGSGRINRISMPSW